jgi:hypothetical protein
MTAWLSAIVVGMIAAGCSDDASDTRQLERRLDDMMTELRQLRTEIQRGNERLVTLINTHNLQGATLTLPGSPPGQLTTPEGSTTNMEASKALQKANAVMSEAMSAVPLTGDPDRDFLAQMVPHHQGAIDMSKVLLKDGLRPEVRRFAQEIIAHQQGEIELMNRWLAALGK